MFFFFLILLQQGLGREPQEQGSAQRDPLRSPLMLASVLMHYSFILPTILMHCVFLFPDSPPAGFGAGAPRAGERAARPPAILSDACVGSDALLFRVFLNTTIPRVYACACAHVREGFYSFALVCKYLGRFRLEIRRRYYCTAYFPLKDFRF